MPLKIFALIALASSALFLPWWTTLAIALVSLIVFPLFYPVIAVALMYDLAYGVSNFVPTPFFSTFVIIAAMIVIEAIRQSVIFYR